MYCVDGDVALLADMVQTNDTNMSEAFRMWLQRNTERFSSTETK